MWVYFFREKIIMGKIFLRCLLTVLILLCLRYIYISIVDVPFFEQVFISTSLGLITSQLTVEVILNKARIKNSKK